MPRKFLNYYCNIKCAVEFSVQSAYSVAIQIVGHGRGRISLSWKCCNSLNQTIDSRVFEYTYVCMCTEQGLQCSIGHRMTNAVCCTLAISMLCSVTSHLVEQMFWLSYANINTLIIPSIRIIHIDNIYFFSFKISINLAGPNFQIYKSISINWIWLLLLKPPSHIVHYNI